MQALANQHCTPRKGAEDKLDDAAIAAHLNKLNGWEMKDQTITKRFSFENFIEALHFTNKLGAIAEAENHHPDLTLGWGYVGVTLSTHDCGGISLNDMIMAAKIEAMLV
jgi:4a-hydroxytetrahydrobiopterin dehydratase